MDFDSSTAASAVACGQERSIYELARKTIHTGAFKTDWRRI
jgi:hypothetical protein